MLAKVASKFLIDDRGFIISSELVLLATILVLGILIGMQTIRETVIFELKDTAIAIGSAVQSYSFGGVTGHNSSVAGTVFSDDIDFCEAPPLGPGDDEVGCINIIGGTAGRG